MSGVKWIKITTNIFDDEKINFIESLPEADTILIIWIKLLTLAGKVNSDGLILLSSTIPYTEEMLAHKFRRPLSVVKLALKTFIQLEMVDFEDGNILRISNWEKHQNIEGLEKIREQNRVRKQRQRARNKAKNQLSQIETSIDEDNSHVTSHLCHGTDIEEDKELELELELEVELDKDKEKEIDPNIFKEIVQYLNENTNKNYKYTSKSTQTLISSRIEEGFTTDDFKTVIDNKIFSWADDMKMNQYLRPSTLFGNKFESYLNEQPKNNEKDYGW